MFRFYGPINPIWSCRERSVYLTTLSLGRLSPLLTSIVHVLSPETDNCPSWISGRERMTVENISWLNLYERMLPAWGGRIRNLLITSWTRIHMVCIVRKHTLRVLIRTQASGEYHNDILIQYNLNGSNPDGSFTADDSNYFFSPYKILPIGQENKYLGTFSDFIMELYVVFTH